MVLPIRLKLRGKLGLIVALIACALGAVTFSTWRAAQRVAATSESVEVVYLPQVERAQRASKNFASASRQLEEAAVLGDVELLQRAATSRDAILGALQEYQLAQPELDGPISSLRRELPRHFQASHDLAKQLADIENADQNTMLAISKRGRALAKERGRLQATLTRLVDDARLDLRAQLAEATSQIRHQVTLSAQLGGATLLLLGLTLLLLGRQVVSPLRKLNEAASRIARGELNVNVEVRNSGDEVSELEHAFAQMTQGLQASTVSRDYVDSILETMVVAITVLSEEGRIEYANDAAARLLKYSRKDLIGRSMHAMIQHEDATVPNWEGASEQHYITSAGVLIPVAYSGAALSRANDTKQFVCAAQDISEAKLTEAALRAAREEALAAVNAKAEFLATMSHEIRTPMNGVIGMTSLLMDTELSRDQQEYVHTVHSCGAALMGLINNILDFSKLEAGAVELEKVPFDLRSLMDEALEVVAEKASQAHLDLALVVDDAAPDALLGDPTRIRQILLNLLSNAVKFTSHGSVVVLVNTANRDGVQQLEIEVRDTGIGIDELATQKLFQPFTQADGSTTRKFGGTGLGLSISLLLAHAMGGDITVNSTLGIGTAFRFCAALPTSKEKGEGYVSCPRNIDGKSILVVDAFKYSRSAIASTLTGWGCDVQAVEGNQGIREQLLSRTARPIPFDLVLACDTLLSDFFKICHEMNIKPPRVVAMRSPSSADIKVHGTNLASGSLLKPVKRAALARALATQFGQVEWQSTPGPSLRKQSSGTRILVVDDNKVNRKVASKMLSKLGCDVTTAENGVEAVRLVEAGSFHLVFMDCQMPTMDGYEATRRIRASAGGTNATPIVAMTANALKGDRERCLDAGMDDHVAKPITREVLSVTLDKWVTQVEPDA